MLTIVIPAHNEEEYLPRCLKSLKEQDYSGEYEIIVVDNCSDDNTARIAHDFGVGVVSCSRRGVVYAREAGFRVSRGEIVVQADADTIYPPQWLSRIVECFSSTPEIVAVTGDVLYEAPPLWVKPLHLLRRIVNTFSLHFWKRPIACRACAFAFRREALLKAGGYNTKLPFVGDERDLLLRLSRIGKIIYDHHLLAVTSSRQYSAGFWHYLLVDWLYQVALPQALFVLTGRSLVHSSPRRGRYSRQLSFFLGRAFYVSIMAIVVSFLSYGYFSPTAQVFGKTYDRVASPQKAIALTFDDGPNEPYTSQILDILNSYGVKGTFFTVGKNVEFYPDVARRIVAEGHVLGNHSYSHKALADLEIPDYSELDKAQNAIFQITGVKPRLFRPPYGRKTPWGLEYVKKKGMITVTWSASASDPSQPSSSVIKKRILEHARPGTIILLHDGGGTKHSSDRSRTVAALPGIIESLAAQGFTFVTIPELLQVSPYLK